MNRNLRHRGGWLVGASLALQVGFAAEFKPLRFDEDYRALRDASARAHALDLLKYVPLGADAYVTLGGELRLRHEYFRNSLWGQGPQDGDGYLLTRAQVHADLHPAERWRIFAQLKSGVVDGRNGGPRATDEDQLDWNQAFFDYASGDPDKSGFKLRLGRQELAYGSSRLISFRESPNVRQSFDGITGIFHTPRWRIDTFAAHPVETDPGVLDDAADRARRLWGIYAVT